MWSVTVGTAGPQGVSEGHQEEGGFVTQSLVVAVAAVWGFLGGSSPPPGLAPHQSRDGEARTLGSSLTESWDEGPGGFFSSFSTDGAVRSKGTIFPKPQVGGGKRRWGCLPPHPGRSGCRARRGAIRVSKTVTETRMLMETGMRVLGPWWFWPVPRWVPRLVWQHRPPRVVM